jgi:hypothetical protein
MNERIDKLLVKAGAYFGGEGVDYSNFDPKKFAELIVKECVSVAMEHYDETLPWGGVEQIKEHFGVEE